jgi:EmrB/QacA subfamily drug resistance transporter
VSSPQPLQESGEPHLDPRRWFAAAVVIVSVLIPVLNTTILYVALVPIGRELRADLPSLQWVITGYSLTFATFVIIGGRLGDMFGHRRTFIAGVTLFGFGSLIAGFANSVVTLFIGEAVIQGIGASLMLPATLAILATTFTGHERVRAFAWWGAVAGVAVAFGPIVGGFLTTKASWRWAFGINVLIAPVMVAGAFLFMRADRGGERTRLDGPGALLIAAGSFSLVFGLSMGARYGWWTPVTDLTIAGNTVWPATQPVSLIPFAFLVAALCIGAFVLVDVQKERTDRDPLFAFSQLRHRGFRWGLLTTMVLAMGQFAVLFVVPVLLQRARNLSALGAGAWLIPQGVVMAFAAPFASRLAYRISVTSIVRLGLVLQVIALGWCALVASRTVSFWALLPALLLFGIGIGFASSQLTNVVMSDVDPDKTGVAGGANTTVRQVGLALGIAVFSSFLHVLTIRHATSSLRTAALPEGVKTAAREALQTDGVNFAPPAGVAPADASTLRHLAENAVASGARPALLFAAAVVTVGTALSFLIPKVTVADTPADPAVEPFPSELA